MPDSNSMEAHVGSRAWQTLSRRLGAMYVYCAVTLFSVLLLLGLLTAALAAGYGIRDAASRSGGEPDVPFVPDGAPVDTGTRSSYQLSWFDFTATSELGERHVSGLLDDFWMLARLGFVHQPWVGFSEPLFRGMHVAVVSDPKGIPMRRTINPAQALDIPTVHVFTFGGSSTFGYHVADEHTWPSELSAILNERARSAGLDLRIEVSNYGRGFFDTSQAAVLAIDLVKSGRRPDLAIFMEGVNLGLPRDVPWFTGPMTEAFWNAQHPSARVGLEHLGATWLAQLPFGRLMRSIDRRLSRGAAAETNDVEDTLNPSEEEHVARPVKRFRLNRQIASSILGEQGSEVLHFIQPDPAYNYPPELYRRELPTEFWTQRERRELFHELMRGEDGVILLTDLFEAYGVAPERKAILDDVHYTPGFNRFLAERVADEIDLDALVPRSDDFLPTGFARAEASPPEGVIVR